MSRIAVGLVILGLLVAGGTFAARTLKVLDLAGRRVTALASGPMRAGRHLARWNVRSASGQAAPPGIYFIVLEAGGVRAAARVVVTR